MGGELITWEAATPAEGWSTAGLNLTVLGLMAVTAASEHVLEGEALMAPARSSEKDLKPEQVGLDATGFAMATFSVSLISIFSTRNKRESKSPGT